jgi:pimeloyl-ACP methyl ester carboxylesterase
LTKQIYIFSGLGADERVFQKLDFSGYEPCYIKWLNPYRGETMEAYALRLLDQIQCGRPTLIGLSFGGLIAIEIAKRIETNKVIIIASAKTRHEIPFYFRLAGNLRLLRVLPVRFMMRSNVITNWLFGTQNNFEKLFLKQVLEDTDPGFFRWAIEQVAIWPNKTLLNNIFHIHGTRDRILPHSFVKGDLLIANAGHMMVYNRADELNRIIRRLV